MIRTKLGLYLRYLAVVLIPILVLVVMGTASVMINQEYAASQDREINRRTLEQIRSGVDFIFDELDALNVIFSTSSEFLVSLNRVISSSSLTFDESRILDTVRNFVNVSAYARPYVESIYVYIQNPAGKLLTTTDGIVDLSSYVDRDWFDRYLARPEAEFFWTETRLLKRLPAVERGRLLLSLFRRTDPLIGVRAPGVVVLNIYRDDFDELVNRMKNSQDQKIVILDGTGGIVSSDFERDDIEAIRIARESAGQPLVNVNGSPFVTMKLLSPKYGWTYMLFTPVERLYQLSNMLRALNIAVVGLSVILGLLLAFWVSRRSFRHVEGVLDAVAASERDDPLPPVPEGTEKGFSHVTYSILRTFIERRYLQVQLSERKYRQKTLELLALQSQMNPHFLFNTLETINWKVIRLGGEPGQINEMIGSLSRILKYSLAPPSELETLDNEIAHARDYLGIQKIRYKNKFSVTWDCAEGLGDRKVIRFILQPLLENAIYHGIKEAGGRRRITVEVRESDGRLVLSVSDDGLGISPDRLNEIRTRLGDDEDGAEPALGSIGLFNTHKRIWLAFGDGYGLSIRSTQGEGTTVDATLPSRE
jgi:two-component system sensor histidine kinase YesM